MREMKGEKVRKKLERFKVHLFYIRVPVGLFKKAFLYKLKVSWQDLKMLLIEYTLLIVEQCHGYHPQYYGAANHRIFVKYLKNKQTFQTSHNKISRLITCRL